MGGASGEEQDKQKIIVTMAKMNPASTTGLINNLFNLKYFNSLKKDQTNIKIFKDSSFESSFNSVQSLNTNLSNIQLFPSIASTPRPVILRSPASAGGALTLGDLKVASRRGRNNKNIKNPKFIAILRAIRSIRLNRDEWRLIRFINLMEKKIRSSPFFCGLAPFAADASPASATPAPLRGSAKKEDTPPSWGGGDTPPATQEEWGGGGALAECVSKGEGVQGINNNIISKNLLLRNTNRYKILKSTLSSILKKKIRSISEVLEDKPIKNYIIYSYLKNCISLIPPHLNGGKTKLSLNKYKGRKYGSFIKYNKIIGYKFNSTFYQSANLNANTIAQAHSPSLAGAQTTPRAAPSSYPPLRGGGAPNAGG